MDNNNDSPTILLTGATGFLGSHLVNNLVNTHYNIIILKRSSSNIRLIKEKFSKIKYYDLDAIDIEEIFFKNSIEGIIHIATDYGKRNFSLKKMLYANIELPTTLLILSVKHDVKYFINTHTSANSQYNLYASMKNGFVEITKYFASNYPLKVINMRLEYMYGEFDDNSKFIPYVIESMLNEKEINATGGEQKRDFIYIKDVVDAYLKLLSCVNDIDSPFIEFEIGTGKGTTIKDFVHEIELKMERKANINWGRIPYGKNEIFNSRADIKNAQKILNWNPQFDIKRGILKMLENSIDSRMDI